MSSNPPGARRPARWPIWWVLVANVALAAILALADRGGEDDPAWRRTDRAVAVLALESILAPLIFVGYLRWYWAAERRRIRRDDVAYREWFRRHLRGEAAVLRPSARSAPE